MRRGMGQVVRRVRRVGTMAALAAMAGAVVAGCEPVPPVVVENPGEFTGVTGPGSFYEYLDAGGNPTRASFFDAGNPMCANGIDDDADGRPDDADPQCVATGDANERLDGPQEYGGSYLATTVEEDGRIVVDPADLHVEPMEKCLTSGGELWCLEITPRGSGPVREGILTRDLVVVAIPMTIDFDVISGYPGFDPRCEVGHTENIYAADDYDPDTGRLTLQTLPQNPAPAMEHCGDWTGLFTTPSDCRAPGTRGWWSR